MAQLLMAFALLRFNGIWTGIGSSAVAGAVVVGLCSIRFC
jgi:hypothetical protein